LTSQTRRERSPNWWGEKKGRKLRRKDLRQQCGLQFVRNGVLRSKYQGKDASMRFGTNSNPCKAQERGTERWQSTGGVGRWGIEV